MAGSVFRLDIPENQIAILTFDDPDRKVNVLTPAVMAELDALLIDLQKRNDLKGLILTSGKPGIFIAGADIFVIKDIADSVRGEEMALEGQEILNRLSKLPFPTIAAIDGACLGGGLEVALACTYRVATTNEKTKLGAPEVNLGIIPGFGGTQRLPRLISLPKALDLILTGRSISGRDAKRIGLVNDCVEPPLLIEAALKVLKEKGSSRKPKGLAAWTNPAAVTSTLASAFEKSSLGQSIIYQKARESLLAKTRGHYPAPLKAIDVVRRGVAKTLDRGLAIEARAFGELVVTDVSKQLIRIYELSEEIKRYPGVEGYAPAPLPIRHVAVLGAGTMGAGIAQVVSYRGFPVRLRDVSAEALSRGMGMISKAYRDLVKKRRMTKIEASEKTGLVTPTLDDKGFGHVDLVIEAALEKMDIKKEAIKTFAAKSPNLIFASNTSSLSVGEMAQASPHPERVIGMHFFNPAPKMPLIEVIRGPKTSPEAIVTIVDFSKKIGKTPIVVKDAAGFLVNRVLMPYLNEAALIYEEGNLSIPDLDEAMLDFGMPMGPFTLLDEIGLDIGAEVAKILYTAFGDRMKPSALLPVMVGAGRLGKKKNAGFYKYGDKKPVPDDAGVRALIPAGPAGGQQSESSAKTSDIAEAVDRMVLVMVNECARAVEEGIVRNADHADMAMILGTGFPPFRGGLIQYARSRGLPEVVARIKELEAKFGGRFEPVLGLSFPERLDIK